MSLMYVTANVQQDRVLYCLVHNASTCTAHVNKDIVYIGGMEMKSRGP